MDEIDLWADLAPQRVDIASKAAAALEKRLADVATYDPAAARRVGPPRRGLSWRN